MASVDLCDVPNQTGSTFNQMMMVISIVNHKGGTGKTTTTINLGAALAMLGRRVLLLDMDPQGSMSYSLGIDDSGANVADVMLGEALARDIIQERENMEILPAGRSLADVELAIARTDDRLNYIRQLLNEFDQYDFVLIDCPPSLSILTLNALNASDYILVPMQMDVLALRGFDSMLETVNRVRSLNPRLEVLGVLPIMASPHKNIYREITSHIKANYGVRLFMNVIRSSVKAAEAPSFGRSVISYAPGCSTACDYRGIAGEITELLSEEMSETAAPNRNSITSK